jgi:16S rRNA (cytosine967-C5)-methyltransferase
VTPPADRPETASLPLARLLDHAADAVEGVRGGASLTDLLARVPVEARAGTQAIAFHVLRWLGGAQAARALMAPKAPPPRVDALLTSAIALLWPQPAVGAPGVPLATGAPGAAGGPSADWARAASPAYADHTVVDQAVTAARQRTPAAAGFVNAVLRRFVREREAIVKAVQVQPQAAYNHPGWWIERLRLDWPAQWQALLEAANRHPPMTLRVNARRGNAEAYVQRLAAQGRAALALDDHAVLLAAPCPVTQLPGFAEGEVSVQDAAAQLAAPLLLGAPLPGWLPAPPPPPPPPAAARSTLDLVQGLGRVAAPLPAPAGAPDAAAPTPLPAGARVLDACAAPGGKTAHLLERADLDLLALDSDPLRLQRVQDTLNRLGLRAELKSADARDTARWWDGRPFDAILLDAPCSGSGVVRRHPDIRWLRRPDDIAPLARMQAELLDALWPLLKPGGRLVYATCSVFKAEGQAQIDAFLQRSRDASPRVDPRAPGHLLPVPDNPGSAVTPGTSLWDGFFYALLEKPY